MDIKTYEKILNDINSKCPIEDGVEILIYNILNEIIESKKVTLVNISGMEGAGDKRLQTEGGTPDFAITTPDFEYKEYKKGEVKGFIEAKRPGVKKPDKLQLLGHITSKKYIIFTNGKCWKFYKPFDGQEINELYQLMKDANEYCDGAIREGELASSAKKKRNEIIFKKLEENNKLDFVEYPSREINLVRVEKDNKIEISEEKYSELISYLWTELEF